MLGTLLPFALFHNVLDDLVPEKGSKLVSLYLTLSWLSLWPAQASCAVEEDVVLLFNLTPVSVFAPQDPYGHGWFVWSLPAALERGGGQRAVRM